MSLLVDDAFNLILPGLRVRMSRQAFRDVNLISILNPEPVQTAPIDGYHRKFILHVPNPPSRLDVPSSPISARTYPQPAPLRAKTVPSMSLAECQLMVGHGPSRRQNPLTCELVEHLGYSRQVFHCPPCRFPSHLPRGFGFPFVRVLARGENDPLHLESLDHGSHIIISESWPSFGIGSFFLSPRQQRSHVCFDIWIRKLGRASPRIRIVPLTFVTTILLST